MVRSSSYLPKKKQPNRQRTNLTKHYYNNDEKVRFKEISLRNYRCAIKEVLDQSKCYHRLVTQEKIFYVNIVYNILFIWEWIPQT